MPKARFSDSFTVSQTTFVQDAIPGDLSIDVAYDQASWNLQLPDARTSYEHLKFNYGACSAMFSLLRIEECLAPPAPRHVLRVVGVATLVRGVDAASSSQARHQCTLL